MSLIDWVPSCSLCQVNFFIGAFYDGVMLLGMALNETLSANESLTDGRAVTLRMWNRTFQGNLRVRPCKCSFVSMTLLCGSLNGVLWLNQSRTKNSIKLFSQTMCVCQRRISCSGAEGSSSNVWWSSLGKILNEEETHENDCCYRNYVRRRTQAN